MSFKAHAAADSQTMRQMMAESLHAVGVFHTVSVANGDNALANPKQCKLSLALTDWSVPGKSGVELIHEIRDLDRQVPDLHRNGRR